MKKLELFAVSPPGFEGITLKELQELNLHGDILPGGVRFYGDMKTLYRTNLFLRSASRILLRISRFKAKHFGELVRKAAKCPWEMFITENIPIKIRVTSRKSKLIHTKAIEERILKAIKLRTGFIPEKTHIEDEGTSIIVRFEKDICTISINSSGAMLHKRGYRKNQTEAPIRENLAAALIMLSNWDKTTPFVDPFCGSGTFPIEAALLAANIPPGINRTFAFMKWKNFDPRLWEETLKEAKEKILRPDTPIYGFDISKKAIKTSIENAKAAGVDDYILFERASFPRVNLKKAHIVTNPPYGIRLRWKSIEKLYQQFGKWIRQNFKNFSVTFITPQERLAKATGLNPQKLNFFSNSGIKVYVWHSEKQNYT